MRNALHKHASTSLARLWLLTAVLGWGTTALAEGPPSWRPERGGRSAPRAGSAAEESWRQPRDWESEAAHRAPLAPGEFLLDHNRAPAPGDPPYVLRDDAGQVQRLIEPTAMVDLDAIVGSRVRIRHDTGRTLLATQLELSTSEAAPAEMGPPRAFAPEAPGGVVLPIDFQTDDPSEPIVLEELPTVNPDPPPAGEQPLIEQPPFVTAPPMNHAPARFEPRSPHVCGPECEGVCPHYLAPPPFLVDSPFYFRDLATPRWDKLFACRLGPPWRLEERVHSRPPQVHFGGWTQVGWHSDQTPLSTSRGDGLAFNDVPDGLRLHQQWFWLQRTPSPRYWLDWGFRFDMVYGTDAQKTQAYGNPSGRWDNSLDHGVYGWALPQLYGEVVYRDLSVIAGHFFTPVGYEVVPAPENFFYSHSLTMFNSEPFTHTGVLATYSPRWHPSGVSIYGGWSLGWDTGFDQAHGGSNLITGFSADVGSGITFAYVATLGNLGLRSGGGSGYSHSIVADVAVTPRLNYVVQTDLVGYDDDTGTGLGDDQLGLNQYLFYSINDCWALGTRLEWWKSDGQSFYEMTYGLNYRPHANLTIRPEIRYDWTPSQTAGYSDGRSDETTLAVDAVLVY